MKFLSDTEMKATELYFSVALFIMLYIVVRAFESVDEATEQYFNDNYAGHGGSHFQVC